MKLSDAEWTVMNALWQQAPASARDVLERLPDSAWAYTTVKTLLTRLDQKGAVRSRLRANTTLYEPAVTREQARRSAVRSLLDRAFDGAFAPLLQHLFAEEKLSKKDRQALGELLRELDGGAK